MQLIGQYKSTSHEDHAVTWRIHLSLHQWICIYVGIYIYIYIYTYAYTYTYTNVYVYTYRLTSNISRALSGNKLADHSDVVGASPVGAAPTTSSFST